MEERCVYIYSLNDPTSGAVRYIGQTSLPELRRWQHIKAAKKRKPPRDAWICGLLEKGESPTIEFLDEVPASQRDHWEGEYIRLFRALGMDLTNVISARRGPTAHTEETRKRISERMKNRVTSPETREKRRRYMTGRKLSPEHCESLKRAWVKRSRYVSPESRKKMSLAHMGHTRNVGRKHSDETRLKHSLAMIGRISAMKGRKHSSETRLKMSESQRKRFNKKTSAETL